MKNYLINITIITILSGLATTIKAQNFTKKAKVENINKSGFYKIKLTPLLNSLSQNLNEDVRLFDNNGKEIPFLLKKETSEQNLNNFEEYSILENNTDADWQVVIIQNNLKSTIDKLLLEIKNADADREVKISGSDDKNKWFIVRDNFSFTSLETESQTNITKLMTFPSSDYRYYKIEIKNKNKNPINILRIGYNKNLVKNPEYQEVQGLKYTRKDSGKTTILNFTCSPANRIDRLQISILSPTLFKRNAILSIKNNDVYEKDDAINSTSIKSYNKRYNGDYSQSFELSSDTKNIIDPEYILSTEKQKAFTIRIQNDDNEPLQFTNIKGLQLNTNLIAELIKDKHYFIYTGDSLLTQPSYDLVYFENKIDQNIPTINIEAVQDKSTSIKEEYNNNNEKWMVWIGLGIVAIILVALTSNMLKGMKKEEQ